MEINNVKGTHDVFLKEANEYEYVEGLMKAVAELFAFNEIRPPVLEYSDVFVRGVGESSDVVRKEMYTFEDKAKRNVTLRPEFTAGIARLLVQNKLLFTNELPFKAYYVGPVFRYERPQLGRYRQFNQFGVESIGHNSFMADIEVIVLAFTILQSLKLSEVKVKINTLGDEESRDAYRSALKEYFAKYISNMCEDCKQRYEINPLRILDCKDVDDQEIIKNAPKINEFLSESSKKRFNNVLKELDNLQIPYEIDDTLVRGLDYYSETVFEFHYISSKGNNYGAIGAGGHYGKLVSELGGPNLPGVGFSFGIERIVSVLSDDGLLGNEFEANIDFYIMPMNDNVRTYAFDIITRIRLLGYKADFCFDNTKVANQFKRASKKNAKYAVIIGDDEMVNKTIVVKDMDTQEQTSIKTEELEDSLITLLEGEENECCCGCHCNDDEDCCCEHGEHKDCKCNKNGD